MKALAVAILLRDREVVHRKQNSDDFQAISKDAFGFWSFFSPMTGTTVLKNIDLLFSIAQMVFQNLGWFSYYAWLFVL